MPSSKHRTIQESEQFRLEKNRITFGERYADDVLQTSVYWPLANDPECGVRSKYPGIWMYFFEPAANLEYVVYFQFNEETVLLLSIQPAHRGYENIYV
jgi:hypothetical protein